MVDRARATLARTAGRVEHTQLEDYRPIAGSADLVTCRLAAHDPADLDRRLRRTRTALRDNGRLLMTVVHPVLS